MRFRLRTLTLASVVFLLQSVTGFLNLSFNKTADMSSSQHSDKWLADEAIDGDLNQEIEQNSCAVTAFTVFPIHRQAWWRVDLGAVYVLNSVKVYYRKEATESFTHRLSGFSIYVADTLNWWIGTRCYLHNNGEYTNPGPNDILTVPCNATGRYVTVYNQRNNSCVSLYPINFICARLELCEVQVLGCEDGTYGESCSNNCRGNCLYGGHCNKAHGGCDDGCAPGYRGFYCNEVCPHGKYGINCSSSCSANCIESLTCRRTDGYCEDGCWEGWQGHFCDQKCTTGTYGRNCQQTCYNCQNYTCKITNGSCESQCIDGFIGTFCNISLFLPLKQVTVTRTSMYVGVSIGCAVFVAAITIALAMFTRRLFAKKKTIVKEEWRKSRMMLGLDTVSHTERKENLTMEEINTETETIHETNNGDKQLYMQDIPVSDLADVIRKKTDTKSVFRNEFKALSKIQEVSCDVGRLPVNKTKNRYNDMIAYDHSRVVLNDTVDDETDYINSNYIKDIDHNRVYIACQGPKQNTVYEHWRMIWQENIDSIVMLTNLKEKSKMKCYQYWPDTALPLTTGNITITNKRETTYSYYIVRQLDVHNAKSEETRTVRHFHFTNWLDHSTPDPLELISFYRSVISTKKKEPMLVHCSAGIGRTGVFIALDALLKYAKKTEVVNVFKFVMEMREDRRNMVQTLEQYIFVHNVVLEGLRCSDRVIHKSDFTEKYKNYVKNGTMESEYQTLNDLRPTYGDNTFTAGKHSENVHKNRDQDILPVDSFAVKLKPITNETSVYINAVFAPSYTKKKEFIVSQFPLPHTVNDLWRMMYGYPSSTLVVLNEHTMKCDWLPEPTKATTTEQFVIQKEAEMSRDHDITECKLKVNCTELAAKKPLLVKVFKANVLAKGKNSLMDANVLLDLLKYVFAWRQQNPRGYITVLSSDGVLGCGLFCGVYAAIEQIQLTQEVDISTILRQLQKRRPQLCSTLEEYQACYRAISLFIQRKNPVPDDELDANVYINIDL